MFDNNHTHKHSHKHSHINVTHTYNKHMHSHPLQSSGQSLGNAVGDNGAKCLAAVRNSQNPTHTPTHTRTHTHTTPPPAADEVSLPASPDGWWVWHWGRGSHQSCSGSCQEHLPQDTGPQVTPTGELIL